ncbi:MAG: efflux RND transporter permease subunit, partial [Bacteroidetes bacterium]|nr:efflux RND transporter permease subunit [Bacteroidota bacterium]
NRTKAASYGVPLHEIDRTIRAAFAGVDVSRYRDEEGKEYDIVIRMPFKIRPSLSDFDKVFVKSMSGRFIPLKQVTDIRFSAAPTEISHFKAERTASVTCDVAKGYTVDEIQKQMQQQMSQLDMPDGYSYIFGGELESREETFGGMAEAAIIAIIAIFAVLVLQFRSFGQPLIIFVSIPLAIIGSIWALYITGWTFSFTALIGMTSLIGIVINDSIILVDYSNVLMRDEKKNTVEAVIEAGQTRFMPILLTSLTTIGGLLPLTLRGGALWAPMGWTIIGGLLFSTVLTLIVVPVLYSIFTTKNQNSALKQDPIEI